MIEAMKAPSLAHLRHEYRTPVNHIIGYSELLIEDAGERHLEPYLPVFQQIHEGGHDLLKAIQGAFSEQVDPPSDSRAEDFKANLLAGSLEMSGTLAYLCEDLDRGHRQTIADLDAISWAVRRLLELAGREGEAVSSRPFKPTISFEEISRDVVPVKRGGGKILIADDDASNRNLLRRRLECEGHEVVEAANGLEVLDALKNDSCDLVLLDIMMPAMDGFETLARLKQDTRLRDLPIIMISALDELESVVRCIEMGADDYLAKPFNRVLLRARIGASLEKKWLRDRERRKADELECTLRLLEQAQEQLAIQASRDALTGLANRRTIDAQLDFRVKKGTPFTVIYIDLNGFKRINDTYGHGAGDDLLKQVGSRLRSVFRSTDIVGRWGGDEFVALMDVRCSRIKTNISRIMECLADDFVVSKGDGEYRVNIGASVGAATWKSGDTATDLLHRADLAMYEQKLRCAV